MAVYKDYSELTAISFGLTYLSISVPVLSVEIWDLSWYQTVISVSINKQSIARSIPT